MFRIAWRPGLHVVRLEGRAIRIFDGDTVTFRVSSGLLCVRLYGVDAPEVGQRGFQEAKSFLGALLGGRTATISPVGRCRYGRTVARVRTAECPDVSAALLLAGLVWWEFRWSGREIRYREAQGAARGDRRGLWKVKPWPMTPWEWRRRLRIGG